ncbi:MAG: hypothetical protein VXV96_07240 [Bdellovibrionota bacterium]|jgi:hypothetical protein|nr:hypothetical protein [Bdellovibrionota bacterium]
MSAARKFKELFTKKPEQAPTRQKVDSKQEKLKIEQLQKAIQERIKKDPKAAKKAAMILEKMLK